MARLIPAEPLAVAVDTAVEVLGAGGVVVLPTETVYGIAGLPGSGGAIERIFDIKQRLPAMHLAVLIADPDQRGLVSDDRRPAVAALASQFWPGPLTMILPAARDLVSHLGADDGTVGVRCPDHELARAIARRVGPLAATSANLHGRPTPSTGTEVALELPDVDLVIDAGACGDGVASTVVSLTGEQPVIVREGSIGAEAIIATWAG